MARRGKAGQGKARQIKMTQKKSFIIDTGILSYTIHVCYLYTDKELQKYADKHFGGVTIERTPKAAAQMYPLEHTSGYQACIIDFHDKLSKSNVYNLGIITHEAMHAVLCGFRWLGVDKHDDNNEEFFCYSLDFVFRKIYEGLFS